MTRTRVLWSTIAAALAAAAIAVATAAGANGGPARAAAAEYPGVSVAIARQLDRTKAALEKYRSVEQAKADGYEPAGPCELQPTSKGASWWGGAMGVHYMSQRAVADGKLIATKPEVLLYVPTAGGGVELAGVEYFQPDADQNLATDADRPSIFGRTFDGPMLGHAPGMPKHYDLHVWLWKHNPSGVFASWNPAVSCT